MENEIKSVQTMTEDVADIVHRVSCLCDLLSYLGDTESVIPEDSFCDAMGLIRDILEKQVSVLDTIGRATGKMVAA